MTERAVDFAPNDARHRIKYRKKQKVLRMSKITPANDSRYKFGGKTT
jgi:hypothetical protein